MVTGHFFNMRKRKTTIFLFETSIRFIIEKVTNYITSGLWNLCLELMVANVKFLMTVRHKSNPDSYRGAPEGVLWSCRGVLWSCRGVLWSCRGVLRSCRGVLWSCRGVLRSCRGVLRSCRGVLWSCRGVFVPALSTYPELSGQGRPCCYNIVEKYQLRDLKIFRIK